MPDITRERLKELMNYDSATGEFSLKVSTPRREAGARLGFIMTNGYRYIAVDGKHYLAHRLAWLWTHGEFPKEWLCHFNGDRDDNRISNIIVKRKGFFGKQVLTQERLRQVLDYDPVTGKFFHLQSSARGRIGAEAGVVAGLGYRFLSVDGKKLLAHRLAHFYMTNEWPAKGMKVDHINGQRDDNRWLNLRLATNSQNVANAGIRSTNKLGVKGVSMKRGKYLASVVKDYRQHVFGPFDTLEEAKAAYAEKSAELHGAFARSE